MVNDKLFKRILLAGLVVVLLIVGFQKITTKKSLKLYWFIPDGVRAEPNLFNVYKWAQEGKLPNIKKLMEQGSYGYSYPNFPSHTPTNFATLLTGSYPEIHGVNDGPMRALGKPLDKVAVPGFRSTAKKVPPIWKTLEEAGYKVGIISVPGSTPPEVNQGVVLRGRWGGWGADFHAINFETKGNLVQRIKQGSGTRLFYLGPQLTQYIDAQTPKGWLNPPQSYSAPMEVTLDAWGAKVYAYIYDSTDDLKKNYDKVSFSKDKQTIFANLTQGQWSDWEEITLKWQAEDKQVDVESDFRATVIKLDSDGFFRLRLFYNNLNSYITQPEEASEMVQKLTGPMVDFADNFPAQLIYYPEDKKTFEDEADMSFEWHKKAVSAIYEEFAPNVIIHDIYTPNQMLTTRWWMGYVDPVSARYGDVSDEEREKLWQEVQDMYKKLDDIVGEILKISDKNTYIVFTSDHGAVPLDKNVFLNNLFAKNGWLKFTIDPQTGESIIDWKNSKVIYLKMAHVYINPNGLDGSYRRASGAEYEKLRQQVIDTLESLKDTDGTKPLTEVVKWEDAKEFMQLDPERVGDLVIANAPGYWWNEEMSKDLKIFSESLITGYKQAIESKNVPGMWVPFIIAGPGVKKNYFIGDEPFEMIDQYPTIMKALGEKIPDFVQGKALDVFK